MRNFDGYLKGVNLGGWLSQCGNNYTKEHYDTFITEKDFETIKGWGLDHVRVPVDAEVIQNEDGTLREDGLAYLDSCMEWCKKYGLNMILDLHKAHGYVFDDENNCQFFYRENLQDIFVELWCALTDRYAKNKDFVCFELLNEVTSKEFTDPWNKIATRTIKAIREKNRDIRIVVGGIFNDSIYGLTLLDVPVDENTVFTFHCYSPIVFTHQGAYWIKTMPREPEKYSFKYPDTYRIYRERSNELFGGDFAGEFEAGADDALLDAGYFERMFKTAVDIAEKNNVPLYCGEYGVIDLAKPEELINWYKDINAALVKYNIARSAWSFREMNFSLDGAWLNSVRNELLKYM